MSYYHTCPHCGAHLDPGEFCDCGAVQDNNQRFNALLNSCAQPRRMYDALLALGRSGMLDEMKAALSAANTGDGGGVDDVDHVSASIVHDEGGIVKWLNAI